MLLLRSLIFNVFLYSGITIVFLLAIPALFLPSKITSIFGKFLGHYVIFIVRFFLNTKVEFKGLNNIPNNEKYFVASAHQSMFETFALQSVLDYPVFILKKELLKIPLFGLYLKKIKSIEITRDTITKDNLNFFDKVASIIKNEKRPLLIFPQGTRIKPEERVPFKKGVGRIYEALKILGKNDIDLIMNIQGDEPEIDIEDIKKLYNNMKDNKKTRIGTLAAKISDIKMYENQNIVKVKTKESFEQNQFPLVDNFFRNVKKNENIFHHIGIYCYEVETLKNFVSFNQSKNELDNKLEQLRALDNKIDINVAQANSSPIGIDTKEDYLAIKKIIEYK